MNLSPFKNIAYEVAENASYLGFSQNWLNFIDFLSLGARYIERDFSSWFYSSRTLARNVSINLSSSVLHLMTSVLQLLPSALVTCIVIRRRSSMVTHWVAVVRYRVQVPKRKLEFLSQNMFTQFPLSCVRREIKNLIGSRCLSMKLKFLYFFKMAGLRSL